MKIKQQNKKIGSTGKKCSESTCCRKEAPKTLKRSREGNERKAQARDAGDLQATRQPTSLVN